MDDEQLREHFGPREERAASRWSRWQLIAVAAVALLAVGIAMVWFYVLAPDERSTADIESQIETWAEDGIGDGTTVTVDCPDPVEWRVGETFNCVAKAGGESVGIAVTMENDAGEVTWRAG